MRPMLWAKRLLQRLHLAAGLIEFCHDCGVRQPLVWWADDALYREVCGGKGVLCPECFNERAHQLRILLMWTPAIEMRDGVMARGEAADWQATQVDDTARKAREASGG